MLYLFFFKPTKPTKKSFNSNKSIGQAKGKLIISNACFNFIKIGVIKD